MILKKIIINIYIQRQYSNELILYWVIDTLLYI